MKSTTGGQLAEQAFHDYQKLTQPTDNKRAVAFMTNRYLSQCGVPMAIAPDAPQRLVKIALHILRSFNGRILQVVSSHKRIHLSTKWLESEIKAAWSL